MTLEQPDPGTPVLIGVGQAADPIDGPDYQRLSPVELCAAAASAALEDTGADPARVAAAIDTLGALRQFDNSVPGAVAPFGGSDNPPRSVAKRIGADPRRAILEVTGGQGPQHLVTELAGVIHSGGAEVVLVCGAEAISTVRHLAGSGARSGAGSGSGSTDAPDWTERIGGQLEDRGFGLNGLITQHQIAHGLLDGPSQYAIFENARRAASGLGRAEYAAGMGELFAPFTRVAAANPYAAAPRARTAGELVTVDGSNRMVADPYPRLLCSRDAVNQGAAVLLASVAAARELRVPESRWVYLHGHADLTAPRLLDRPDLGAAPASAMAVRLACELAGIDLDRLAHLDLYSCFPIAVSTLCDELGLAADDPRGLTVTGGLPFFGGPGNNYSMHAIAALVARLRADPGSFGLVGANGGTLSKYSAGVYSTTPCGWRPGRNGPAQAEVDGWPTQPWTLYAGGPATVESWTVKYERSGPLGIVIGRLDATGERFVANTVTGDTEALALLESDRPAGTGVFARSFGFGNRVTLTEARMDELHPRGPAGLRTEYQHLLVRRDGHLLEVTINRPDRRNCLHPEANAELDEVFDAYFADPELWVAILTGAGERSFSAGNDLVYQATGGRLWIPRNGFAGLTARPGRTKPVIAAVNGAALAGGFEIALACDLVVADPAAVFGLTEVKVGLVAALGGIARLPRVVGEKAATELVLTGRRMDAEEARRLGVVNRVSAPGKALDEARALAAEILANSPTSVRLSMRLMADTAREPDVTKAAALDQDLLDEVLVSADAAEGVRAFAEKRAPRWRNH